MYFFDLIEQHSQVFVTYLTGALYVLLNLKNTYTPMSSVLCITSY